MWSRVLGNYYGTEKSNTLITFINMTGSISSQITAVPRYQGLLTAPPLSCYSASCLEEPHSCSFKSYEFLPISKALFSQTHRTLQIFHSGILHWLVKPSSWTIKQNKAGCLYSKGCCLPGKERQYLSTLVFLGIHGGRFWGHSTAITMTWTKASSVERHRIFTQPTHILPCIFSHLQTTYNADLM